jgi:hypothetical protein
VQGTLSQALEGPHRTGDVVSVSEAQAAMTAAAVGKTVVLVLAQAGSPQARAVQHRTEGGASAPFAAAARTEVQAVEPLLLAVSPPTEAVVQTLKQQFVQHRAAAPAVAAHPLQLELDLQEHPAWNQLPAPHALHRAGTAQPRQVVEQVPVAAQHVQQTPLGLLPCPKRGPAVQVVRQLGCGGGCQVCPQKICAWGPLEAAGPLVTHEHLHQPAACR